MQQKEAQNAASEPSGNAPSGRSEESLRIPDHELIRCIGAGAFGEVWLASPTSLPGTFRAVKVVRRNSLEGEGFDREFNGIQRFEPISRSHPNLVTILHVGENRQDGYFFYVMELADQVTPAEIGALPFDPATYEAKTLHSELCRRGRFPIEDCIEIGLSLTSGLAHLHRNQLLHRDIKPANIIFVKGIAKLADIGLVADANTATTFVGTSGYMPPEGPGQPEADIYSLGKVLYEMVTGLDRQLFPQLPDDWETLPNRKALARFNQMIVCACESNVDLRYHTAEELEQELLRLHESLSRGGVRSLRASRHSFVKVAAGALLAAIAAILLYTGWLGLRKLSAGHATTLTTAEQAEGFKPLFNGKDLEGWSAPANNWACSNGIMTRLKSGGDITYEAEPLPDNFDLRFEWKVARGTDSGVLYRPGRVEYQILDNKASPFGTDPKTWAGALFDFASEPEDRTQAAGKWNQSRVVCEDDRIRHYLNGSLVLDAQYTAAEWQAGTARLKTKYNTDLSARGGYLVLRDEDGPVWYRNIRLKELE